MTSPTPAGSLKAAIEVIPPLPEASEYTELVLPDGKTAFENLYDEMAMLTYARAFHAANSADLLARLEVAEKALKKIERICMIDPPHAGKELQIAQIVSVAIKGESK